jgi:hypothetical protein
MRARGRPLHYDLPDDDFGPERPSYENVPEVVEGEYIEHETPFGPSHVILFRDIPLVVDPDSLELLEG